MAGKGQSPKRKSAAPDAKNTGRAVKPAAGGGGAGGKSAAASAEAAPEQEAPGQATPDAVEPEAADEAVDAADADLPPPAADELPHPERHPLAQMRDESSARGDESAVRGDAIDLFGDYENVPRRGAATRNAAEVATAFTRGHDGGAEWVDSLREQIREQPAKALLMAAGAGFLYGLLSGR